MHARRSIGTRTIVCAVLTACAVSIAGGSARADDILPPPATASAQLGALEANFVREYLHDEPVVATALGFHDGDDRLPDLSAAGYAARIERSERYLAQLAQLPPPLSVEDAADIAIVRAALRRELLDDRTLATWRHQPALYTRAATSAVSSLFARGFAPIDVRLRSTIDRETAIPPMLAGAAANITTVDPVTAATVDGDVRAAIAFFRTDVPTAYASVNDDGAQAKFKAANDAVLAALETYRTTLAAGPLAHPAGTFAIGPRAFAQALAIQEGQPLDLRAYERAGAAALARTKADFIAAAKRIDPARAPQAVLAALRRDHPSADDLMPAAERELAELRTLVIANHLVTFPADGTVLVRETPAFDRTTATAALVAPGAFEKVSTQAYYYLTPVDPAWTPEQQEAHLESFNYATLPVLLADEVVPGAYVNFALHRNERLSLVRTIFDSRSFTDGWAHYCDEMLVESGLGNGDPRVKLAALAFALRREARYLVGLHEHAHGMSVDAAAAFFAANAFLDPEDARREALRGTSEPLYGDATLGRLEILKLRADYQRKVGANYSLGAFNDALLAHGNPPIGVLRSLLLGDDDDGLLL